MERERERYFPGDFSVNFHGDSSSPLLLLDDLLVSAVDGAAVVVVFCYLCSVYSPLALSRSDGCGIFFMLMYLIDSFPLFSCFLSFVSGFLIFESCAHVFVLCYFGGSFSCSCVCNFCTVGVAMMSL